MRTVYIAVAAAAVGAGTALLLAPQSGERTRRQIRHKAEDLAKDFRETVGIKASDAYERGVDSAHYLGRRFRGKVKPTLAA
jgi:gas vesicle protein